MYEPVFPLLMPVWNCCLFSDSSHGEIMAHRTLFLQVMQEIKTCDERETLVELWQVEAPVCM